LMSDLLPVTPEYVAEVLRSEPFGYWRFEQLEQGKVANEIDGGEPLEVHGTLRLSGTHDNRFGEFGRPGDESYLMSPHPLTIGGRLDYSFECWVKPSHQHRGGVLALIAGLPPGKPAAHGFYLELQGGDLAGVYSQDYPESVRFLHRNPPSHLFRQGTSCFSNQPYTLRRWQHVVATKQGPDMKLYVNGEVVAAGSDPAPLAEGLRLLVGRAGHANNAMSFVGQLDEIAIFDRALTKQEIDRRHELMWESKRRSGDPKREI